MNSELPIPAGIWLAIFPITFIIHFAEEYWAAGGYVAYLYRLRGVRVSEKRFLFFQGLGFVWFSGIALVGYLVGLPEIAILFISGFYFCNGVTHTVTALWDRHYGPGLIASIFLWMPLGLASIVLMYGHIATWQWAAATGAGLGFNGLVALGTMKGGKL